MHTEENCWFSPEHHYMVKFKDQMMSILYEEFDKLYKSAIEEVSDECKRTVDLQPCTIITDEVHQDDQAVCYIENSKAYAFAFNDMEECSKHALSETQSKLLYMLMDGILSGWHKIHTSC
uniref:Uncharacterized protein n=1 Tax=Stomoxys calcitrans TaxID=35570 RepID=A0A1I8P0Y3_STOCA